MYNASRRLLPPTHTLHIFIDTRGHSVAPNRVTFQLQFIRNAEAGISTCQSNWIYAEIARTATRLPYLEHWGESCAVQSAMSANTARRHPSAAKCPTDTRSPLRCDRFCRASAGSGESRGSRALSCASWRSWAGRRAWNRECPPRWSSDRSGTCPGRECTADRSDAALHASPGIVRLNRLPLVISLSFALSGHGGKFRIDNG